jgi:cbb3-type cytochrome oxidase cytochrome c subunit
MLHVGRDIYVVESCDQHHSSLVDAEPLDGNWDRR